MNALREEDLAPRESPHSLEAESSLLGGLLLAPERFAEIEGRVDAEDFFSPAYGSVFQAMTALSRKGQPLDILMLRSELERMAALETVGGAAGISALMDAVPTGAHVEYYAEIVRDKARLRRLSSAATEIVSRVSDGREDSVALLDFAEHSIFEISTAGATRDAQPIANVLKEAWEKIDQLHRHETSVTGIPTDYHELDNKLSGLHESELIIIAGRPSMGKSTFALNMARHIAVDHGQGVALFSLEMSDENLARHLLCAHARVDAQRLKVGKVTDEEWSHLIRSTDELSRAPVYIDDTPGITLAELRGKVRRLKMKHDVRLCVIDYLQLISASGASSQRSREQEISEISRGLKMLAKELSIPVIALSQLNRNPTGRTDKRPMLSDLRESGAIEQDADVVLLLHRTEYYDPEDHPGEAEIIIAKQRNGPTGTVNLIFLPNQLRFENPTLGDAPLPEASAGGGAFDDELA